MFEDKEENHNPPPKIRLRGWVVYIVPFGQRNVHHSFLHAIPAV